MSVIAKLYVQARSDYGTGSYVQLGCVASNEVMAAYAGSEEDKLFSRYSPSGEIRIHQAAHWSVFPDPRYITFTQVECYSVSRYAYDGSRVELREVQGWVNEMIKANGGAHLTHKRCEVIERLSWKMHVDNPPAEAQFVPGRKYWLAFYPVAEFDRDKAIAAAHGHKEAA